MASGVRPGARRPAAPAGTSLFRGLEKNMATMASTMKVFMCPNCGLELVRVSCRDLPVRMCARCKGAWLPECVVREFAGVNGWFEQLESALELELKTQGKH
jgi:hypothetical protein